MIERLHRFDCLWILSSKNIYIYKTRYRTRILVFLRIFSLTNDEFYARDFIEFNYIYNYYYLKNITDRFYLFLRRIAELIEKSNQRKYSRSEYRRPIERKSSFIRRKRCFVSFRWILFELEGSDKVVLLNRSYDKEFIRLSWNRIESCRIKIVARLFHSNSHFGEIILRFLSWRSFVKRDTT